MGGCSSRPKVFEHDKAHGFNGLTPHQDGAEAIGRDGEQVSTMLHGQLDVAGQIPPRPEAVMETGEGGKGGEGEEGAKRTSGQNIRVSHGSAYGPVRHSSSWTSAATIKTQFDKHDRDEALVSDGSSACQVYRQYTVDAPAGKSMSAAVPSMPEVPMLAMSGHAWPPLRHLVAQSSDAVLGGTSFDSNACGAIPASTGDLPNSQSLSKAPEPLGSTAASLSSSSMSRALRSSIRVALTPQGGKHPPSRSSTSAIISRDSPTSPVPAKLVRLPHNPHAQPQAPRGVSIITRVQQASSPPATLDSMAVSVGSSTGGGSGEGRLGGVVAALQAHAAQPHGGAWVGPVAPRTHAIRAKALHLSLDDNGPLYSAKPQGGSNRSSNATDHPASPMSATAFMAPALISPVPFMMLDTAHPRTAVSTPSHGRVEGSGSSGQAQARLYGSHPHIAPQSASNLSISGFQTSLSATSQTRSKRYHAILSYVQANKAAPTSTPTLTTSTLFSQGHGAGTGPSAAAGTQMTALAMKRSTSALTLPDSLVARGQPQPAALARAFTRVCESADGGDDGACVDGSMASHRVQG